MIHRVPVHVVPDVWPALVGYAERACKHHPFLDAEDLFTILMNGYGQLFVATDETGIQGFVICEVIRFPKVVTSEIVAAAGRYGFLDTLKGELLREMEQWAQEHGATVFSVSGRPGWTRVTRSLGFETMRTSRAWRTIDGQQRRNH